MAIGDAAGDGERGQGAGLEEPDEKPRGGRSGGGAGLNVHAVAAGAEQLGALSRAAARTTGVASRNKNRAACSWSRPRTRPAIIIVIPEREIPANSAAVGQGDADDPGFAIYLAGR